MIYTRVFVHKRFLICTRVFSPPCIHHPPNAHHSSSKALLQKPFSRPQQRMFPEAIELMHSLRQLLIPASTVEGSYPQSTHISGPIYPHRSEKFEIQACLDGLWLWKLASGCRFVPSLIFHKFCLLWYRICTAYGQSVCFTSRSRFRSS